MEEMWQYLTNEYNLEHSTPLLDIYMTDADTHTCKMVYIFNCRYVYFFL